MTPAKRAKAEAVTTLIRLGWSPPPPNSEQAQRIIDDIVAIGSDRRGLQARADSLNLTQKELVVLSLVADGHTQDAVAERMHYSPETVKAYVKTILRKLGARNITHAVAIAYRAGDLDLGRAA